MRRKYRFMLQMTSLCLTAFLLLPIFAGCAAKNSGPAEEGTVTEGAAAEGTTEGTAAEESVNSGSDGARAFADYKFFPVAYRSNREVTYYLMSFGAKEAVLPLHRYIAAVMWNSNPEDPAYALAYEGGDAGTPVLCYDIYDTAGNLLAQSSQILSVFAGGVMIGDRKLNTAYLNRSGVFCNAEDLPKATPAGMEIIGDRVFRNTATGATVDLSEYKVVTGYRESGYTAALKEETAYLLDTAGQPLCTFPGVRYLNPMTDRFVYANHTDGTNVLLDAENKTEIPLPGMPEGYTAREDGALLFSLTVPGASGKTLMTSDSTTLGVFDDIVFTPGGKLILQQGDRYGLYSQDLTPIFEDYYYVASVLEDRFWALYTEEKNGEAANYRLHLVDLGGTEYYNGIVGTFSTNGAENPAGEADVWSPLLHSDRQWEPGGSAVGTALAAAHDCVKGESAAFLAALPENAAAYLDTTEDYNMETLGSLPAGIADALRSDAGEPYFSQIAPTEWTDRSDLLPLVQGQLGQCGYAAADISGCTEVTLESYTFSAQRQTPEANEMKFFCVRIAGTWYLWYPDASEG